MGGALNDPEEGVPAFAGVTKEENGDTRLFPRPSLVASGTRVLVHNVRVHPPQVANLKPPIPCSVRDCAILAAICAPRSPGPLSCADGIDTQSEQEAVSASDPGRVGRDRGPV